MSSVLTTLDVVLEADPTRTVIRPFEMSYPPDFENARPDRAVVVAERVLALGAEQTREIADRIIDILGGIHRNITEVLLRRIDDLPQPIRSLPADAAQRLVLGATFSEEYAFESAALFNPSIAATSPADSGDLDFVLSLRGVGEGHVSSVTFRTGVWHADGTVTVDKPSGYAVPPTIARPLDHDGSLLVFADSEDISENIIFPVLPSQRQGVEDLRLVWFTESDGTRQVLGTYTAFDGRNATSELLRGANLREVEMRPLSGRMAQYKGMALFPRRISGQFVMLGRQDSERVWLLRSDDLYRWDEGEPIMTPKYPWESVQIGNCGSPVEVDEGWLVLTHGVGPLRSYCIGACLLDRDDPAQVLARTPEPILTPSAKDRGGYVPNVVYSCGMLARGRDLLIPYGVGDRFTTFATGTIDAVLAAMEPA